MGLVRSDAQYNDTVRKFQNEVVARRRVKTSQKQSGKTFASSDRDIAIRTIIGEAANEGQAGWAAVAHNLRNRVADSRFPDTLKGVALQPLQYSAWNEKNNGGNHLVDKYKAGDKLYDNVGRVVDAVMSGQIKDATNGAVNYYAYNTIQPPRWWTSKVKEAGGNYIQIGGHRFAGKSNGQGVKLENLTQRAVTERRQIAFENLNLEQKKQFALDNKPVFETVNYMQNIVTDDVYDSAFEMINDLDEVKGRRFVDRFRRDVGTASTEAQLSNILDQHNDLEASTTRRN